MKYATVRPRARLDLLEQFVYFSEQSDPGLADRFFAAVDRTCKRLLRQPRSGALYRPATSALRGMRRTPVDGFERLLIFYVITGDGIDLVRVLHGAQDVSKILMDEPH